jgi:hypothetical protein
MAIVGGCKHLDCLLVANTTATDDALVALATHRGITYLRFIDCPGATEGGLTALVASCRSLCFLRVVHPDISAAAVARIAGSDTKCTVFVW